MNHSAHIPVEENLGGLRRNPVLIEDRREEVMHLVVLFFLVTSTLKYLLIALHVADLYPCLDLGCLGEEDLLIHSVVICLLDFDSVLDSCFVYRAVEICLVLDRNPCLCLCLYRGSIFCHDECRLLGGHRNYLYPLEAYQDGLQAWPKDNKEKFT